jgi:hypothetical protein
LDDYEEGTWTPDIRENTTSRSPTYAYIGGAYIKIGNLVWARFGFLLSNKGSGSGSGAVRIYGLPFTASSPGAYQEPNSRVAVGALTTASNASSIQFFAGGASTYIESRLQDNGDTPLPYTEITNSTFIVGTIIYTL